MRLNIRFLVSGVCRLFVNEYCATSFITRSSMNFQNASTPNKIVKLSTKHRLLQQAEQHEHSNVDWIQFIMKNIQHRYKC